MVYGVDREFTAALSDVRKCNKIVGMLDLSAFTLEPIDKVAGSLMKNTYEA